MTAIEPDASGFSTRPTVVIIGAGFSGLAVARALARCRARVIVVDRQNHHLFQPLLYQVATASLSGTDIAQPIRHILRRFSNVEVLRGEVTAVDRSRELVHVGLQALPYDWLVVATGATHNYFGHEAWAEHAPGLKSLADAQELRGRILDGFEIAESSADAPARQKALTFVVVGGGPTGVELAGSIAELAAQTLRRDFRRIDPALASVRLFEAGPRILPTFPDDLAEHAQAELTALGVTVHANTPILDIGPDGVRTMDDHIEAHAVIWTAGVKATAAAGMLAVPADRGGRIAVDETLRLPDDPAVFVIGDIALVHDQAGRPLPGLAQVARQQGQYVGASLRDLMAGRPAAPFRYRDLGSWAIVGRNAAVAVVGGWKLRGRLAWMAWGLIHIALLVGFENRFRVMLKWMWEYLTRRRSARLIVTQPPRVAAAATSRGLTGNRSTATPAEDEGKRGVTRTPSEPAQQRAL